MYINLFKYNFFGNSTLQSDNVCILGNINLIEVPIASPMALPISQSLQLISGDFNSPVIMYYLVSSIKTKA